MHTKRYSKRYLVFQVVPSRVRFLSQMEYSSWQLPVLEPLSYERCEIEYDGFTDTCPLEGLIDLTMKSLWWSPMSKILTISWQVFLTLWNSHRWPVTISTSLSLSGPDVRSLQDALLQLHAPTVHACSQSVLWSRVSGLETRIVTISQLLVLGHIRL